MKKTEKIICDRDIILGLIADYVEGPRLGSSKGMRSSFATDAVMTSGNDISKMEGMFSFVDDSQAYPDITYAVRLLYVSGSIANAVVDVNGWGKDIYEDIFTFAKTRDGWKIVSKTYRLVRD